MATKTQISFKKFIADIKANEVPENLKDLYHKVKIEAITTGRKMNIILTIPVFRRLFSINEILRLITHYTSTQNHKQLTIF